MAKTYPNPLSDTVVLCVDPTHARYGQVGELISHDLDGGVLTLRFADGTKDFPDGLEPTDEWRPTKRFYRYRDERGSIRDREDGTDLDGLVKTFLSLNVGDLNKLKADYQAVFNEPFPP